MPHLLFRMGACLLAAAVAMATHAAAAPPPAGTYRGAGFDAPGFDAPGFNSGGFNAPAAARSGFNGPDFNSQGFGGRGRSGGGACGRMAVPAASLAETSRGFGPDHAGIDLVAAQGMPIRAAAGGMITYMGTDPMYGLFVDIRHAERLTTRYAHMSAFAPGLASGSHVRAGTEIGRVGATGNAHGAHLHFEVRIAGQAVDPKPFLVGANCAPPPQDELLEARAPDRPRRGSR